MIKISNIQDKIKADGLDKGLLVIRELTKSRELIKSEETMTINEFAVRVCKKEKGKKEVDIAQVMEILKVIDGLMGGKFYSRIKHLKLEE